MNETYTGFEAAPRAERQTCDCFCAGVGPEVTRTVRDKTEAARDHLRTAGVEFLKAVRSLIDDRIDHMSRTQQKGTTIPVD